MDYRAKAEELAQEAFRCSMADEGYAIPDAMSEDQVVAAIEFALREAYIAGRSSAKAKGRADESRRT